MSVCEQATHTDRECARERERQILVSLYDAEESPCVRVRGREREREREKVRDVTRSSVLLVE